MDKIKTVKIKESDGSISEETYTISVDAKDVDMANGKELQETIGTIDIDTDGNIAEQLENLNNNVDDLNIDIKKKAYFFDTVADMKNANLKIGDYVCTLGYYEANDGGAAEYQILTNTNKDYFENLKNGLKAELIINGQLNVKQIGAYGDKIHDDIDILQSAIDYCASNKLSLFLDGIFYISRSLDCKGVHIIGVEQPTASGAVYPNNIGWNYPRNISTGSNITFNQYINTIVNGTAIISDIANPILITDYNKVFNLENFGVYGWLRNANQEGLLVREIPTSLSSIIYYPGGHKFNHFSVFNTGSNGIHLHSLEVTTVKNLIIELCNGYGLYIEGLQDKDCPFDYMLFEDCRFRYTRLAGIYLYNTYRHFVEFNHCNFNYIGQCGFGECNDTYGTRTMPTTEDEVIYAIDINGYNAASNTQHFGKGMCFYHVYGEQSNGFLKVANIPTVIGFDVKECPFTRWSGTSVSCHINLKNINYFYDFYVDYSTSNVHTQYKLDDQIRLIRHSKKIDGTFYNSLVNKKVVRTDEGCSGTEAFANIFTKNLYSKDSYISGYDQYSFNQSQGTAQTVTIDMKKLIKDHFVYNLGTTTGQSYTLALLSISAGGNTTAPGVVDLIAITKHNNHCLVSFITNNTGATATSDGIITIEVPAWKIANIQFIQQVDTSFLN